MSADDVYVAYRVRWCINALNRDSSHHAAAAAASAAAAAAVRAALLRPFPESLSGSMASFYTSSSF